MKKIKLNFEFYFIKGSTLKLNSLSNILYSIENLFKKSLAIISKNSQSLSINMLSYSASNDSLTITLLFNFLNTDSLFSNKISPLDSIEKISNPENNFVDVFKLFYKFRGAIPRNLNMHEDIVRLNFNRESINCDSQVYKLYSNKEFQLYSKNLCKSFYLEGIKSLLVKNLELDSIILKLDLEKITAIKTISVKKETIKNEIYPKIKLKILGINFPQNEFDIPKWSFYAENFDYFFVASIEDKSFISQIKEGKSFSTNEYLFCKLRQETSKKGKKEVAKFYIEKVLEHIQKDKQISMFLDL